MAADGVTQNFIVTELWGISMGRVIVFNWGEAKAPLEAPQNSACLTGRGSD